MDRDLEFKNSMLAGQFPDIDTIQRVIAEAVEWNKTHLIGTEVIYHPTTGQPPGFRTKTCSLARIMNGHTAVVIIEGWGHSAIIPGEPISGGWVPLEKLEVVEPGQGEAVTPARLTPEQ